MSDITSETLDTSISFNELPQKHASKKELYRNIKMSMQEIQRVANDIDHNMKKIRVNVDITATLLNTINNSESEEN
ncbi:hypothetical protein M0804_000416 [Polistes exclamans]|nr:hypothetical protein M0804_000416 [Polistes exclamans]